MRSGQQRGQLDGLTAVLIVRLVAADEEVGALKRPAAGLAHEAVRVPLAAQRRDDVAVGDGLPAAFAARLVQVDMALLRDGQQRPEDV
jgi:hypothetical protein